MLPAQVLDGMLIQSQLETRMIARIRGFPFESAKLAWAEWAGIACSITVGGATTDRGVCSYGRDSRPPN